MQSLNAKRPVIAIVRARAIRMVENRNPSSAFTKGSHAWVIDGYQIRVRLNNVSSSDTAPLKIVKPYNVYCHANMGWGGSCDGWHLFNYTGDIYFECYGDQYEINLACYPNARLG